MSYPPVYHPGHSYQHNPNDFNNGQTGHELNSMNASSTSLKSSFVSHGIPAREDVTSDHQHLLQKPITNAYGTYGTKWTPGVWRQFPGYAIGSLFGVLACTIASLAILVKSHKQPVDEWGEGISPPVYLAIASVIANALTAYALAKGLDIIFWRNALGEHTVAELNQTWLCGHNLYHALVYGYRAGGRVVSIACIFTVIALLRGPLNQRASTVQSNAAYDTSGSIQLSVAQKLPAGYTGLAQDSRARIMQIARLTPDFAQVMQGYSLRSNMSIQYSDCGDSCRATVKGFGFKTQCSFTEYDQVKLANNAFEQPIFVVSTSLYPIGGLDKTGYFYTNAGMMFNVTIRTNETSGSQINTNGSVVTLISRMKSHVCNVTGGSVEYSVRLSSQTIALASNGSDDRFLEDQILPGPGTEGRHSTIGGFEYAASYLFTSKAVYNFAGARSSTTLTGSLANEMVGTNTQSFSDPMRDMLGKIREIAFRTSVRAGRDRANVTDAVQTVRFFGSDTRSIYVTDFRYMAAAAVLSVASIMAIAVTFYGWWELGRSVSFTPLDIAKAFDAPLLAPLGSNLDLSKKGNLGSIAAAKVRYGEKINDESTTMQYVGGNMEEVRRRLVIGWSSDIRRPNAGHVYGN